MKQVYDITFKKGSDWYEAAQKESKKSTEQKAEEAASRAAETARKEVLEREKQIADRRKAYRDSIRYIDELEFENQDLLANIAKLSHDINEINNELRLKYEVKKQLCNNLQAKCSHSEVIERKTTYTDEYDQWCEGHSERKCIECHLVEKSSYDKLEKSKVVRLRKEIDGKEFELEFNDI